MSERHRRSHLSSAGLTPVPPAPPKRSHSEGDAKRAQGEGEGEAPHLPLTPARPARCDPRRTRPKADDTNSLEAWLRATLSLGRSPHIASHRELDGGSGEQRHDRVEGPPLHTHTLGTGSGVTTSAGMPIPPSRSWGSAPPPSPPQERAPSPGGVRVLPGLDASGRTAFWGQEGRRRTHSAASAMLSASEGCTISVSTRVSTRSRACTARAIVAISSLA